jgi:hypothetical protein
MLMHAPNPAMHCSIGFLPAGWEMGYNHFSGRLGLNMPETAAILQAYWPEWQVRSVVQGYHPVCSMLSPSTYRDS